MTTTEELKAKVREYADVTSPGWEWVTVVVQSAPGQPPETLVVRPKPTASDPSRRPA